MLRGVYFTSVPCQDNHNALVPENKLELSRNTKGLFIKKLLNDIIFPESEIIKMDENYKKENKKKSDYFLFDCIFTSYIY